MTCDFGRMRQRRKPKVCDVFRHALSNISANILEDGSALLKSGFDFSFAGKRAGNVLVVFSKDPSPGAAACLAGLHHAILKHSPSSTLFAIRDDADGATRILKEIREGDIRKIIDGSATGFFASGFHLDDRDKDGLDDLSRLCVSSGISLVTVIGGNESDPLFRRMAHRLDADSVKCSVVVIPDKIGWDRMRALKAPAFGMDTVASAASAMIGNVQALCASSGDLYCFVSMGVKNYSQTLLECAIKCRCSETLLGEEVSQKALSFDAVAQAVADCVKMRKINGKNYGVILFSDDIAERAGLSCQETFGWESGRMLANKVSQKLEGYYFRFKTYDISDMCFGAFPTNFDCAYAFNLGICAFLLGLLGFSGIAALGDVPKGLSHWKGVGYPFPDSLLLDGNRDDQALFLSNAYKLFRKLRTSFMLNDDFAFPYPADYYGCGIELPFYSKGYA